MNKDINNDDNRIDEDLPQENQDEPKTPESEEIVEIEEPSDEVVEIEEPDDVVETSDDVVETEVIERDESVVLETAETAMDGAEDEVLEEEPELVYEENISEEAEPIKKRGFLKFLILPLILGAAYLTGAFYFTSHAMPRTTVNGRDVALKEISSIDPLEGMELKDIVITKKGGDKAVLKPEEIDMVLKPETELNIQQDNFRWPLSLFEDDHYEINILTEYDEAKLKAFIDDNFIKDAVKPVDAKLEKVDGIYQIIPEVDGNFIPEDVVTNKLLETITSGNNEVDLSEFYAQPEIRKEDPKFTAAMAEIDKYTNKELDINFIFKKEKMDKAVLSEFVQVDDKLNVTYNPEKLHEYVVNLAVQYDTYDKYRTFESTNRGTIEVPPGIYGWQMDVAETEQLIIDSLENGTAEIDPIYSIEGTLRTEDGGDIGSTYIEVDLSNQYMWYYEAGELIISAPVVTGDPTRGVATPPGANVVWHKERNKPLEGIDPSGNPYVAPVDYWMAVDWSHTGIHNARWRENAGGFGGNIFMGNGSFGCINTPYYEVSVLYERVPVGTPVLMYE